MGGVEPQVMRCVLVSCCGIPASGKTTFCRSVTDSATSGSPVSRKNAGIVNTAFAQPPPPSLDTEGVTSSASSAIARTCPSRDVPCVGVSHVCFDDHIDRARRRRTAPGNPEYEMGVRCFDGRKTHDGGGRISDCSSEGGPNRAQRTIFRDRGRDGAEWWHEGRRDAMTELEALAVGTESVRPSSTSVAMAKGTNATGVEAPAGVQNACCELDGGPQESIPLHVVLADDNMHFRSMRHEVLRLARKHGCGYAQVYFPSDVETAVERNQARAKRVTESVIRKMAANFQPPDPNRFKWERHTAIFTPLTPSKVEPAVVTDERSCTRGSPKSEDLGQRAWADKPKLASFWTVVSAAAEDPESPSPDRSPAQSDQAVDREATKASMLHRLDLDLREAVKKVADKAKSASLSREALRAVMTACSASRKTTMRRARASQEAGHDRRKNTSGEGPLQSDRDEGMWDNNPSSANSCSDVAAFIPAALDVFACEVEVALSGIDGLERSVEGLVEAARGFVEAKPHQT